MSPGLLQFSAVCSDRQTHAASTVSAECCCEADHRSETSRTHHTDIASTSLVAGQTTSWIQDGQLGTPSAVKQSTWLSGRRYSSRLRKFCSLPQVLFGEKVLCHSCSQWSLLNRFRTEQGHCGACRKKWRLTDTDLCPCGETQTMSHIVESCPLTKLNGGLSRLHFADEDPVSWLTSYGSWHVYEKKKDSRFGDRCFAAAGPRIWNNLPASVRNKEVSCTEFRRQLKTFMFQTDCSASWLFWLLHLINTLTYLLTYLKVSFWNMFWGPRLSVECQRNRPVTN